MDYFTEETLFKVYKTLREVGLDEEKAIEAIREMQNAGILFREQQPAKAASPTVYRDTLGYQGPG